MKRFGLDFVMSRNAENLLKTELRFSIIKRKKRCKYLLTLKVCEVCKKKERKAGIDIFLLINDLDAGKQVITG